MYFQLLDYIDETECGLVHVTNGEKCIKYGIDPYDDIYKSWDEFNRLQLHDLDYQDVDEFIEWHNKQRSTNLERIHFESIQPEGCL